MAKNCPSVDIYADLEFCNGETTLPGLRPEVYCIPFSQIVKWPKRANPGDTEATMSTIAEYTGNFTLAADAVWRKIDLASFSSSLKSESQGEHPSKTFLNTLSLKYAGNNVEAAGFCRMANADNLVYVARMTDGQYRIVGSELCPTDTKPSQDTGTAVTDASGTTLEVTATDIAPAPFYRGELATSDGTIDCSTGAPVSQN